MFRASLKRHPFGRIQAGFLAEGWKSPIQPTPSKAPEHCGPARLPRTRIEIWFVLRLWRRVT